jgi:para-aminobenzoate synthetase component 1
VKRNTTSFTIKDSALFKQQMLNWANRFNIFVLLDNNQYNSPYNSIECIIAINAIQSFEAKENVIEELKTFIHSTKDWLFGHVNYDFKNQLEKLSSSHIDNIQFPDIFLFQPEIIIELKNEEVKISSSNISPEKIFNLIQNEYSINNIQHSIFNIQSKISKEKYISIINQLKQHILRGDCYEINFCQEFFAENATINPLQVYQQLVQISPTPFAGFYKLNDKFLLCASPERYVKKTGNKIISQPIKGTYKRDLQNTNNDELLKQQLLQSEKDKSENVMVVDLVRNDLSKVCQQGSVHVKELFGVYTFPQVHQMISTIEGELKDEIDFVDVLKAAFPMGSMTGAPKKRVMQLIEQYEQTKRGIFSGCVGYITPEKDFDFNVVIRSIMYNSTNKYLSYQVGGGITFNSDAEKEYEECLLKAEAMKKVLKYTNEI